MIEVTFLTGLKAALKEGSLTGAAGASGPAGHSVGKSIVAFGAEQSMLGGMIGASG